MVRVPDTATHRQEFAALPFQQRRQVVSAVNRGREVADPKLAGHAVVVARRQARLWKYAWLLGPLVGAFRLLDSVAAAAVSAAVSTFVLGLMSWWWHSRADRAEQLNYALTTEGRREARRRAKQQAKQQNRQQTRQGGGDSTSDADPAAGTRGGGRRRGAGGGHTPSRRR